MKEICFDSHKVCTFSREMDFGGGMIGHWDLWSLVSFWKPWKLVTRNQTWHAIINHQSWSCQYSFGSPVQPRWIGVLSNFDWIYALYFRWIKVPIIFTFKSSIVPNQVLLYSTTSTVSFPIICLIYTSRFPVLSDRNQRGELLLLEKPALVHELTGEVTQEGWEGTGVAQFEMFGMFWSSCEHLEMVSLDGLLKVLITIKY